jgi:hypothetical protein
MPAKDSGANVSLSLQTQDVMHIGAHHEQAFDEHRPAAREEMYHDLNGVHATAVTEHILGSRHTRTLQTALAKGCSKPNHNTQRGGLGLSDPAQNDQQRRFQSGFEKQGMKRWLSEEAREQAWTVFRHQTSAEHSSQKKSTYRR